MTYCQNFSKIRSWNPELLTLHIGRNTEGTARTEKRLTVRVKKKLGQKVLVQSSSRHPPDTFQTPSRHPPASSTFKFGKNQNLDTLDGWLGGWVVGNCDYIAKLHLGLSLAKFS